MFQKIANMKKALSFLTFTFYAFNAISQNIGIGTNTPHTNAILDINSANKGLLLPRLADTNAVSGTKPAGLTIYSNSDNKLYFYNGTKWQSSAASVSNDSLWYLKNDSINYTNKKYIGINTNPGLPVMANIQATGSLLIQSETKISNSAPTATFTMDNTPIFYSTNPADSVIRILDPGGAAPYINNSQGNIGIDAGVSGYLVHFNPADFGLGTGDTLWISNNSFPGCRTDYFYRFTDLVIAPEDFTIPQYFLKLNFIFRSNADGNNGNGFDITVRKIFTATGNSPQKMPFGNSLYYNSEKGAFRTGNISIGTIGNFSFSSGYYNVASGNGSVAMGSFNNATNQFSVALGSNNLATNSYTTAIGNTNQAVGTGSTALGREEQAIGNYSTAIGNFNQAYGYGSFAGGNYTKANADYSTAYGYHTQANAPYGFVTGLYNDTLVNATDPISSTTPMFIVGNGYFGNASNALVIRYSGNAEINGFTRLGKQTDNAPLIKLKEITGQFTSAIDGGSSNFAHGLNRSKIIAVNVLVDAGGAGEVTHSYTVSSGFEFNVAFDSFSIYVYNKAGNCSNILGKPIKVLITYKE